MFRYAYLLLLSFVCGQVYGNMAKPYEDGSYHSVLFSSKSVEVLKEHIGIKLMTQGENIARYAITYELRSPEDQSLPLLFIAVNLFGNPVVRINNEPLKVSRLKDNSAAELKAYSFIKPYQDGYVFVYYQQNESKLISINDLAYFTCNLKKGINTITVDYDGRLESNNFGFIRNYKLEYALFPSKYWKSFGPVNIEVSVPEKLRIKASSIGQAQAQHANLYSWTLDKLPSGDLQLEFSPKISALSAILLWISPFGLAVMAMILLCWQHFRLIRKYRTSGTGYKRILPLGIFLVGLLVYAFYFLSYDFIDWTLGDKALGRHGYVFLFVFTLPVFLLFYGLVMWGFDQHFKRKFMEKATG